MTSRGSDVGVGGPSARRTRARLLVTGVVQGVGFRPFIHRLAHRLDLKGWVLNSTEGVVIEVEGPPEAVERFIGAIPREAPPLARVERVDRVALPPIGHSTFAIEPSQEGEGQFVLISPDICICEDCLREMRDPADRRFRYPFINCTNCGPRFTIVADIPYDRPKTTMGCFEMCRECAEEYHDPSDRRFHAQPNACPTCGPTVWLVEGADLPSRPPWSAGKKGETRGGDGIPGSPLEGDDAIREARRLLAGGAILAVKGLGGFHLACDATDDGAVSELRRRKRRTDKPFALMSLDADTVATYCHLSDEERQLLESPQRPIVLLRRKEGTPISDLVAPHNRFLGVMLPYTPLHYLLLEKAPDCARGARHEARGDESATQHPAPSAQHSALSTQHPEPGSRNAPLALVMTSGNTSEEPIATGNREALERLRSLADAFLLHDRDIQIRCDDSVTRLFRGKEAVIRRSRGYAPFPVRLGFELRDLLACGAELKNTFCITRGNYAFLSQHIGDLENAETLESFAASVEHFRRLFRLEIAAVACDMHPEYLSTRYAWDLAAGRDAGRGPALDRADTQPAPTVWDGGRLPLVAVQHHHAHAASCMAESGVDQPVIGVSFDGTGYGDDGCIWGGEFLVCDFSGYRRAAHLKYLPLPGGDAAIKRPYRMAISYLLGCLGPDGPWEGLPPLRHVHDAELAVVRRQIERGINAPLTSSMGRLFDAVSSLIGIRQVVNYEGQAAIELEMAADPQVETRYEWTLLSGEPRAIDVAPAFRQMVEDLRDGTPQGVIAARFHNTVADLIAAVCELLRRETGLSLVALSGGVFQNLFLLERACRILESRGFRVLVHHQVPTNDGGIALGQAAIANRVLFERGGGAGEPR